MPHAAPSVPMVDAHIWPDLISLETPADEADVEALYDSAFAPGRAALSSYRLREGVESVAELRRFIRAPEEEGGSVVAAIRYWPVRIGAAGWPALLLGPVAAHPTRQGEGLGGVLIGETLAAARSLGWRRVILVGDEPYYSRFGFTRALAQEVEFPQPTNIARLLALELELGAMDGVRGMTRKWID